MHAKDLAFEDHYPVDKTIEIGTPHPRVTTNTPNCQRKMWDSVVTMRCELGDARGAVRIPL
jgi:hypothetical protein